MENLPGYKEECLIRNKTWWRYQVDNKTPQWVQINLNKKLNRLKYIDKQLSDDYICCKIHNKICPRMAERWNNHQENGCQKSNEFTLIDGLCFPNKHKLIKKINDHKNTLAGQ
jgi:hypothetical protein